MNKNVFARWVASLVFLWLLLLLLVWLPPIGVHTQFNTQERYFEGEWETTCTYTMDGRKETCLTKYTPKVRKCVRDKKTKETTCVRNFW